MLKQPKNITVAYGGKVVTAEKNPVFTGKWLGLATKNISHLSEVNATNKLFTTIPIFLITEKPNPSRINFHGNTAAKNVGHL